MSQALWSVVRSKVKYIGNNFFFFPLLCILGLGLLFAETAYRSPHRGIIQRVSYVDFWAHQIDELGSEKAYSVFKQKYGTSSILVTHAQAHAFGEALFNKEDLEALAVCDDSFGYGCFHSVFAKAISVHGPSIITQLHAVCQ